MSVPDNSLQGKNESGYHAGHYSVLIIHVIAIYVFAVHGNYLRKLSMEYHVVASFSKNNYENKIQIKNKKQQYVTQK